MAALAVLQVLPSPPSTTMASGPGAPSDDRQEEGAILVKFKPLVFSMAADFTLGFQGFRTSGATASTGVRKVAVPAGGEGEALRAMMSNPLVEYAEPVYTRTAFHVPNDARYSSQWALEKISASSAWDITTGSSGIVVAVIDTGIDIGHPDRPRNLLLGADYIADPDGGTLVSGDPQGHGTHVAGIVAANMDNGQGVSGIAPGVTIMAVRVLDAQGSGNTYITAQGIIYAADHGAKIISLSLSGLDRSIAEEEAVNYAHGKGVLVVAAAGNCYAGGANCDYQTNPINYPAALDHVVAVASTDSSDSHAWYSETGSYVDLAAPGSSILSTCINAGYCSKSGTSMSTPYASGVAALAWSAAPALDADEIDSILRRSAVDLGNGGRDDTFGYGRVDAYGAVSRARSESAPPTPTRTPSPTATATNTRTPTPTQTRSPVPIASPSPTPTASASPPPTATPPLIVAPSPSPTATPKPPVTPEPVPTATSTLTPTPTAQAPLLSWPLGPTPTPTQSPPLLSSPLGPKPTPTPLRVFLPLAIKNGAGW